MQVIKGASKRYFFKRILQNPREFRNERMMGKLSDEESVKRRIVELRKATNKRKYDKSLYAKEWAREGR